MLDASGRISGPSDMDELLRQEEKKLKGEPAVLDPVLLHINKNLHVRLAGFDPEGNEIDPSADLEMLDAIEYSEARYMEQLRAASEDQHAERDQQGLNAEMLRLIEKFRTRGMHISRFTVEQQEYIHKNGMIVFIEWEVKEGIRVVLGALTALSCARWDPVDAYNSNQSWAMFPGYDMRGIAASDEDRQKLPERAPFTFNICRSTMLPATNHPLVLEQLNAKKIQLPEDFAHRSTRRMGLGAFAKAVELLIAKRFGMRFVTSNRAVIRYGEEDHETTIENEATTNFNAWGNVIGWRNRVIQFGHPLVLKIRELALLTPMQKGLDGLIGEKGIATRKGHAIEKIRQEAVFWSGALEKSIQEGNHAPW